MGEKRLEDKDELVYFINQKLFPYLRNLKGTPEKEKVAEIFREITNRIILQVLFWIQLTFLTKSKCHIFKIHIFYLRFMRNSTRNGKRRRLVW